MIMDINYIQGDLFQNLPVINGRIYIPHIVNNLGAIGAGFSNPLIRKWPQVRADYRAWFEGRLSDMPKFGLGEAQFIEVQTNPSIVVVNMVGQNGLISRANPHPIKYDALEKCLDAVGEHVENFVLAGNEVEIHAPKFGSERAGGDWDQIEPLVQAYLSAYWPVTIYSL